MKKERIKFPQNFFPQKSEHINNSSLRLVHY